MSASLDLMRLVQMSRELLMMAWHGVQPRRLGALALNLLLAREAATRLVHRSPEPAAKERARRALAFIERLEEQVMRLHATHTRGPGRLPGLTPGYSPRGR